MRAYADDIVTVEYSQAEASDLNETDVGLLLTPLGSLTAASLERKA